MPDFSLESHYQGIIVGVDEVGRGPWAGPVVAAAAVVPMSAPVDGINDSKKLSAKKRQLMYDRIMEHAQVGIGSASVQEIDHINILAATKLAMKRAIADLDLVPDVVLVDGNQTFDTGFDCPVYPVIKGDSVSMSIAAASIVAKVTRDRLMAQLAQEFPYYGWEKNAGYGTKDHQVGLSDHGVCMHHRKSFKPIANLLQTSTCI